MTQQAHCEPQLDHWRDFGLSFDHPLIQMVVPSDDQLPFQTVLDRFIQTIHGNAAVLRFAFLDAVGERNEDWELVLLPEQLATHDSPPASALRGGRFHNNDSVWVIRGWAQLHGEGGYTKVGTGIVVTPRALLGEAIDQEMWNMGFAQFIPDDAVREPDRSTRDIPWVNTPAELVRR
jgi:hypothetical protein